VTKPKRPRDPNQLAKLIVGLATRDLTAEPTEKAIEPAISDARAKAGRKGGAARAKKLTAAKRTKIASAGAKARWRD